MPSLTYIDTPEGEAIDNSPVTIGQSLFIPHPEDDGGALVYRTMHRDGYEYFAVVGTVLAITEHPDDFLGRITPGSLRALMDWWDGHPNDLANDLRG